MSASYEARLWSDVKRELSLAGISYTVRRTRSPRDFFKTDEERLYVVRVREMSGVREVTLAAAPARSDTLAADDALRCGAEE